MHGRKKKNVATHCYYFILSKLLISDQCQHFLRLPTKLMRQSIHRKEDENPTVRIEIMTKVHI